MAWNCNQKELRLHTRYLAEFQVLHTSVISHLLDCRWYHQIPSLPDSRPIAIIHWDAWPLSHCEYAPCWIVWELWCGMLSVLDWHWSHQGGSGCREIVGSVQDLSACISLNVSLWLCSQHWLRPLRMTCIFRWHLEVSECHHCEDRGYNPEWIDWTQQTVE